MPRASHGLSALLLATIAFIGVQAVVADTASPVLVELVRIPEWLSNLSSEDVEKRAAATALTPSFTPDDLPTIATHLALSDIKNQQIPLKLLYEQLIKNASRFSDELRASWLEALAKSVTILQPAPLAQPVSEGEVALVPQDAEVSSVPEGPAEQRLAAARALVGCIGLVMRGEDWRVLEAVYQMPELRRAVLEVWSSLKNPGLRSFLDTRLLSTDEDELLDLVPAYAAAYGSDAQRMLLELARATLHRTVFWACLDPLTQMGVLPSEITQPRADFTRDEAQRFARYTLRAALMLANQGACDKAQKVFLDVAERNLSTQGVRAALEGLATCGYSDLHRVALGYINDPALRSIIIHLLAQHLTPKAQEQLQANWANFPPLSQAALLQVFQQRDAAAAAPLIAQATGSLHAVVRYQSALLLGKTPAEQDLWDLIAAPPGWLQEEAARAYLALAAGRVERGELPEARQQYLALLQGGMPVAVELAAVEGLGKSGTPDDKTILEQLAGEPPLRAASQRALVALAARGGSAEEKAEAVGTMNAREVQQQELDQLVTGIEDAEARAKVLMRAGFVPDGRVAGPFPQPEGTSVQQLHFPITPYPLGASVSYSGKEYPLQPLAPCASGVRFDLSGCLSEEGTEGALSAYAVYELRVPSITGVNLMVHHNAGFAVWLNGKFQRTEASVDDAAGAWYRLPAVLEPGLNYIVVKLPKDGADWHTGLRVTLRDGKPLDLTRQTMPEDPARPVGVESGNVRRLLDKLP